MSRAKLLAPLLLALAGGIASGHGGGLNAEGCHTNKKTGEYHCHGAGSANAETAQPTEEPKAQAAATTRADPPSQRSLPPGCFVGPRGGTYTITKSGKKNYGGC